MTREEAKELIPIIQAFADGKIIEFFKQGEWIELNDPDFMRSAYKYRIKPEPKYRPFKSREECWQEMLKHNPFGWIKHKKNNMASLIANISKGKEVFIWTTYEEIAYSATYLFNDYTFVDGTPFGIKGE